MGRWLVVPVELGSEPASDGISLMTEASPELTLQFDKSAIFQMFAYVDATNTDANRTR